MTLFSLSPPSSSSLSSVAHIGGERKRRHPHHHRRRRRRHGPYNLLAQKVREQFKDLLYVVSFLQSRPHASGGMGASLQVAKKIKSAVSFNVMFLPPKKKFTPFACFLRTLLFFRPAPPPPKKKGGEMHACALFCLFFPPSVPPYGKIKLSVFRKEDFLWDIPSSFFLFLLCLSSLVARQRNLGNNGLS